MSESADNSSDGAGGKSGLVGNLVTWGLIFAIGAGAGFAVPMMTASEQPEELPNPAMVGVELMEFPEPGDEMAYIEFDEVVANLNDPRASRYATCSLSLQVAKTQELDLTKLIEDKKAVLKNWLIAHLRDKKLEDVRGKYGHNLLRREIHGKFNEILFTDGIERIQDVLFRDFKVQ